LDTGVDRADAEPEKRRGEEELRPTLAAKDEWQRRRAKD
jgi:hypothetical protein